jgi:hypothetical protein
VRTFTIMVYILSRLLTFPVFKITAICVASPNWTVPSQVVGGLPKIGIAKDVQEICPYMVPLPEEGNKLRASTLAAGPPEALGQLPPRSRVDELGVVAVLNLSIVCLL